jgi:tRNA modification GTPase
MKTDTEDTIAAIATPAGRSALGIVRISGKQCSSIIPKVFAPRNEEKIVAFRPTVGKILLSPQKFIDEALLTYFQQPNSYTREDLAEITCHGNPYILEQVLGRVLTEGARLARPGEFTFRAFLNGRLDLVQAEAVNDLISADSLYQVELALDQLGGYLSTRLQTLRTKFIELIALMEGNIDFSEEQHYNFIDHENLIQRLTEIRKDVRSLLGTFERGRLIREGFRIALVGKPNVGKSSLFNALLGENRAIVTAIAGTTRDYLQERLRIGNHLAVLLDTAGIRESSEEIEKEGIQRSRNIIEKAELILFIMDGSRPMDQDDFALWSELREKDRFVIVNKADLPEFQNHKMREFQSLPVSSLTGEGINELVRHIQENIENRVRFSNEDSLISNMRHRDILNQVIQALDRAFEGSKSRMSEEYVLLDLHKAVELIGEITGEITIEDIYQHIFSSFCIGK